MNDPDPPSIDESSEKSSQDLSGSTLGRRNVLKTVGAIGLASLALPSTVSGARSGVVPRQLARKLAQAKVEQLAEEEEFVGWRPEFVGSAEVFHIPVSTGAAETDQPAVYVFSIENSRERLGYMTISARRELSPILGYGTQPAPHHNFDQLADSDRVSELKLRKRFIYLGGMAYGVEAVNPMASRDARRVFVDLRGGFSKKLPSLHGIEDFEMDSDAGKREWQAVERQSPSGFVGESSPQSSGSISIQSRSADDQVYDVPNWTEGDNDDPWAEWDGCSPIAASMAIGYHENTSYSNRDDLIDDLHIAMGTDDYPWGEGLTIWGGIPIGINNYNGGSNDYYSAGNNFEDLGLTRPDQTKNQIGDDNPLLLSTTTVGTSLVGHTETVVGYDEGSNFYYKCYDTYGGVNWIQHKSWTIGFTTPIEPQ